MSSLVSERLCLPPKIRPYSLHAPHQVCARDAQATSDLGVVPGRHGRPTGFSVHGWRTAKHFQSAGLTSVEAAGDLVRHIALARSGISLTPGTCPSPPRPRGYSRANRTPRKYQDGPTSWPRWRVPWRRGMPGGILSGRVGI